MLDIVRMNVVGDAEKHMRGSSSIWRSFHLSKQVWRQKIAILVHMKCLALKLGPNIFRNTVGSFYG